VISSARDALCRPPNASLARNSSCARTHSGFTTQSEAFCCAAAHHVTLNNATINPKRLKLASTVNFLSALHSNL